MRMIDTQILVHMHAGRREAPTSGAIASVAAKEFLIAYGPGPDRERYYPRPALAWGPQHFRVPDAEARARHPSGRQTMDRLIIDLADQQTSVVEYGNRTFAKIINEDRSECFDAAIAALEKNEQRSLRQRFRFLVDHSLRCFALEEESLAIGLDILDDLLLDNAPKKNFLNTLRDTMILGVAVKHGIPLQTEDRLLAKLAATRFGVGLRDEGTDVIVDFGTAVGSGRVPRSESKGYINRGWRIAVDDRPRPR